MNAQQKMAVAMDLFDAAVKLQRQNLKRLHPEESAEQIEARVKAWVRTRPGAEFGDAEGRLRQQ